MGTFIQLATPVPASLTLARISSLQDQPGQLVFHVMFQSDAEGEFRKRHPLVVRNGRCSGLRRIAGKIESVPVMLATGRARLRAAIDAAAPGQAARVVLEFLLAEGLIHANLGGTVVDL